jgi:ATP-dependent Lon protease
MEIINLSGYTEEEKLHIAKIHIIPKQLDLNGLKKGELKISDQAIVKMIKNYTMESGVRNLEREIAKISRKAVRRIVSNKTIKAVSVDCPNIAEFLGAEKYTHLAKGEEPKVGVVMGLAWTECGGDSLAVEVLLLPGSGNIISTGKLGEVMQESVKAAYSYMKSQYKKFDIDKKEFSKLDVHVHVPEGAVPKDGPSAGVTICTAITSAFTQKKVRPEVAMTGEITLIGRILGIGGLKEKLLAARRSGITKVYIPEENRKDIIEIPETLTKEIEIKCVKQINEILDEVFV